MTAADAAAVRIGVVPPAAPPLTAASAVDAPPLALRVPPPSPPVHAAAPAVATAAAAVPMNVRRASPAM
ncbi:hypothetical protein GCM10018785_28220 [Streptomyces longispororuber]|uniref:Uncharacterized protein n=1 Tax=Streptomyces longispororuber TaxID=68230 RepID=A0A918ZLC8_9ACTN|nr:hypothetical protein GCM10018785_28220 [Streptomyces longispororuber]